MTLTRPLEDGLVLDLKFNEGGGTVLHDYSGERNHGAFGAGAAAPTWATGWMKESKHAVVIVEDGGAAFWTLSSWGVGAIIGTPTESDDGTNKKSGENSYKIDVPAGAKSYWSATHTYGSAQDWSKHDYVIFWLNYSVNRGMSLYFKDSSNNWRRYDFQTGTGWTRKVIALANFTAKSGVDIDFSNAITTQFLHGYMAPHPAAGDEVHIDRMVLDVAQSVLDFDGGDDNVTTAAYAFGNNGSIEIIITPLDTMVNWDSFFNHGPYISVGSSKIPFFQWWFPVLGDNYNVYGDETLEEDEPWHLVGTWEWDGANTTMKLYMNGKFEGSPTVVAEQVTGNVFMRLAELAPTLHFTMALAREWNRCLSAEEVVLLYAQRRRV